MLQAAVGKGHYVKLNKFVDLCTNKETLDRFTAETPLKEPNDKRTRVTGTQHEL